MAGNVASQEGEKLPEHWIVAVGGNGTGEHHLAIGTDGVVDLIALAEFEGPAHGLRDCGLVAVGKRGFDLEGGGHGTLRQKRWMPKMVMRSHCCVNAIALPLLSPPRRVLIEPGPFPPLEALREAWREKRMTSDDIWRYAKVCRVAKLMRPYLESLG